MFAFSHLFALDTEHYCDISGLLPHDPFEVVVLEGCAFTRGLRSLASDAPLTNLWQYLLDRGGDLSPGHVGQHRQNKKARRVEVDDDKLRQHPWLQSFLNRGGVSSARRWLNRSSSRVSVHDLADLDPIDELIASAVEKQHDFNQLLQDRPRHFAVVVRGGRWTQINMNTPFDCVVSRPSSSSAAAFCEKVGVQKMHSYAFSLYGEEGSRILASETANIYQHFYDVWCGAGEGQELTELFEKNPYTESSDFVNWLDGLPAAARAWSRVKALRSLFGSHGSS